MYQEFFGLKELPFSIAPDPRYLYMSERHREALAHLLYGVSGQGGFVVLTGEVGTGKTTICRCFLNQVPKNTDAAFIVNPKLSARELMAAVCDEYQIEYPPSASIKVLNDLINAYLLKAHSNGRHTVLIIDEAQNLRVDVLEQLRLLTNLETSEKKLLQIVLLGQPELRELLSRNELRQLSQRVTARYHLSELNKVEVGAYVQCRLSVAGRKTRAFTPAAISALYRASGGVPRLINLIADRAMLGAYANHDELVDKPHVKNAVKEIKGDEVKPKLNWRLSSKLAPAIIVGIAIGFSIFMLLERFLGADKNASQAQRPAAEEIQISSVETPLSDNINSTADPKPQALTSVGSSMPTTGVISRADSSVNTDASNLLQSFDFLAPDSNSKTAAFQTLFERWGLRFPASGNLLACNFAENNGLRCMHRNGSWQSLVSLNRPAVLTLFKKNGDKLHVGMVRQEGEVIQISYMGRDYWVEKNLLERHWYGEYSLLWKLPPYKSRLIIPGEVHKEDEWLDSRLTIVRNKLVQQRGDLNNPQLNWNKPLEQKVIWFQQQVGLIPDGIVGGQTIIHLNSLLSSSYPRLYDELEEG